MAKKQVPAGQSVVRIGAATPDKAGLSKAQKEFNRLTRKIGNLEKEIVTLTDLREKLQIRAQTELRPLLLKHDDLRADMVRLLHRMHGTKGLTKVQRAKIGQIVRHLAFELIDNSNYDDLKPIYDHYDEDGFDAVNEEAEAATAEQMKAMVSAMFGIEFDDDADVSTPEKMQAYINEKMGAMQEEAEASRQRAEERRASRPKTAKQQAREAEKQVETMNIGKAVRTLYMDLVKAFHPDREPDEIEKIRKTEVMQRITAAHEAGDLLGLLKLQLEFNRIDQDHLENLADEQLLYYNKILKDQVNTLESEAFGARQQIASMSGRAYFSSAFQVEFLLGQHIRELRDQIEQLEEDLLLLADIDGLKGWLRTYRLERE
jgi:hypothetical protein